MCAQDSCRRGGDREKPPMSDESRTGREKLGGLLGIVGILFLLAFKIAGKGYLLLLGVAILVTGCSLIALGLVRKEGSTQRMLGGLIFLIIAYNIYFLARALFVTKKIAFFQ